MKLIKLTFFRPPHKYGGSSGTTEKTFLFNPSSIISMTEYSDSTKIKDMTGESFEVCESVNDIIKLANL